MAWHPESFLAWADLAINVTRLSAKTSGCPVCSIASGKPMNKIFRRLPRCCCGDQQRSGENHIPTKKSCVDEPPRRYTWPVHYKHNHSRGFQGKAWPVWQGISLCWDKVAGKAVCKKILKSTFNAACWIPKRSFFVAKAPVVHAQPACRPLSVCSQPLDQFPVP